MARNQNLASIEDLNHAVNGWLDEVNEEPIRAFCESRNDRFERERHLLTPFVSEAAPDVRASEEVVVSLEGTIRFETNSYTVPAQYLGKVLTLRYHPITRDAMLYSKETVIRSFKLLPKGERKLDIRDEDRKDLFALWQRQISDKGKKEEVQQPSVPTIDVMVRHPSWYEGILEELAI